MKLDTQPNQRIGSAPETNSARRSFLKYSGATLATAGLVLSGCKEFYDYIPKEPGADKVNLGSGDVGILNYAYTLEQLEAAFYEMVMKMPYHGMSIEEAIILEDIKNHEVVHREFFKAALGSDGIAALAFDFSSIDFDSRESVLSTAKTFEDLGVGAYNGAGKLLKSVDYLLIAGKIVSVEARHAAALRHMVDTDPTSFAGDDVIDKNGLDRALAPQAVLEQAAGFIVNKINANNLPTS